MMARSKPSMSSWRSSTRAASLSRCVRILALAWTLSGIAPVLAQAPASETPEKVLPAEVTINGAPGGIWPILERGGILYAPTEAFADWRVQVRGETPGIVFRGVPYLSIQGVPGLEPTLDAQKQQLAIKADPSVFA